MTFCSLPRHVYSASLPPSPPSYKISLSICQGAIKIYFFHTAFPVSVQTEGLPFSELSFPLRLVLGHSHFSNILTQLLSISHRSFSLANILSLRPPYSQARGEQPLRSLGRNLPCNPTKKLGHKSRLRGQAWHAGYFLEKPSDVSRSEIPFCTLQI